MHRLLFLLIFPILAEAQVGWTRPKGTGYARFLVSTLGSSSFFTPLGDRITSANYRDYSAAVYAEYGITNDWTAVAYFPYLRNHRLDTTGTLTTTGDAIVGFRRRLLRGKTPVSVSVDFGLPTGDPNGIVPVRDDPEGDFRLPTGDGEFNTRINLNASRQFREGKNLISAGGGYNIRSRGFTDEFNYSVSGGHQLFPRLWVSGTFMGLRPARSANVSRAVGFGVGEGVQFLTVGGEGAYRLSKRHSISVGYYKPLSGKNLLTGPSIVFGFGFSF